MPELPEVEITLRGIKKHILGEKVVDTIIRKDKLRWPIPKDLKAKLQNEVLIGMERRSKYLLLHFEQGSLIIHLGMSGNLRILKEPLPAEKHDHVDIVFANHRILRFRDPRRFGAVLWVDKNEPHVLLKNLGVEPLTAAFTGKYLWQKAQGRKVAIKSFLMNGQIVAGIGNIYAMEALFKAGIKPQKAAGKISLEQYEKLVVHIKAVLKNAIQSGGTSFRDFLKPTGTPGYFHFKLNVYGRAGKPCVKCKNPLKAMRQGQRGTVYCVKCQR